MWLSPYLGGCGCGCGGGGGTEYPKDNQKLHLRVGEKRDLLARKTPFL